MEKIINDFAKAVKDFKPDEIAPSTAIEMVRVATTLFNLINDHEMLEEAMVEARTLRPDVFAQLCMESLHDSLSDRLDKVFWLQVAEHMGPDWISYFRRAGAFMAKVEEF